MRALIQRVSEAAVRVDGEVMGAVGAGLLVLVCAVAGDDDTRPAALAAKVARLRVFRDVAGKMNLSLKETGGAALVVSQFTLAADTSRGNRPGFSGAADPATQRPSGSNWRPNFDGVPLSSSLPQYQEGTQTRCSGWTLAIHTT